MSLIKNILLIIKWLVGFLFFRAKNKELKERKQSSIEEKKYMEAAKDAIEKQDVQKIREMLGN